VAIRIITVEREYGSGGAAIASALAERLNWKLWDQELTSEIARLAKVDPKVAQRCDEHVDTLLYRLFKVYARGSYERALPVAHDTGAFDADRMITALREVVEDVASRGASVIVGRGSTYFLRNRSDAYHVFIYAPVEEKIRRLRGIGTSEKDARRLIEEIDRDRAAFIRHYFQAEWPHRPLYNMMLNSKFGDEYVVETILESIHLLERFPHASNAKV
jgi:cytidylate kinase